MMRVIVLGGGKQVPIAAYVLAWRTALDAPEDARFKDSPRDGRGWTGSFSRTEVLREFRAGLEDRINQRGKLVVRATRRRDDARTVRHLKRTVRHDCKWCGQGLGAWKPEHDRYCSAECRRDYYR